MVSLLRGMHNAENNDLLGGIVHGVVDEISIARCHEFAHAFCLLKPADSWKQDEVLQAFINRGTNTLCRGRIARSKIVGDSGDVLQRAA